MTPVPPAPALPQAEPSRGSTPSLEPRALSADPWSDTPQERAAVVGEAAAAEEAPAAAPSPAAALPMARAQQQAATVLATPEPRAARVATQKLDGLLASSSDSVVAGARVETRLASLTAAREQAARIVQEARAPTEESRASGYRSSPTPCGRSSAPSIRSTAAYAAVSRTPTAPRAAWTTPCAACAWCRCARPRRDSSAACAIWRAASAKRCSS